MFNLMRITLLKTGLLFLIVCGISSNAATQEILYVFPETVEKIVDQHLSKYKLNEDKERVYLTLDRNAEIYTLTISTYFVDRDDDLTWWIKGSNRVGLVNTKKYPLLLDMDFDFGAPDRKAVGKFGERNGQVKRMRVLLHGFYVEFSKSGKILRQYHETR
ncbi:MAG: hypothetical protein LBV59_16440 [Sphingobacterium sp.]|uniref:hypothetical protein n=1 Tax=Sphingobacterium sp. TaxID=341027 RepID=UPI00284565C2|nr:hypothetical protein [Sphingobacterium sp.]MDR3009525.1 hypothetical protein [Sphingobacterium sp.]